MTVRERAWWWIGIVAVLCGFVWLFKGILLFYLMASATLQQYRIEWKGRA